MAPGNPWEAMHRLGPKGLLLGAELLWADDAVEAAWADGWIVLESKTQTDYFRS